MSVSSNSIQVRQAVILAGGQATRLRPYTDDRPKALVEVGGKAIFDHQVEWLASGGVEHVVVSCGYKADVLQAHVDGNSLPLAVTVLVEDEPLGRGGGLRYAARGLPYPDERWLGLNGDILTRFPIEEFARQHVAHSAAVTLAVAPLKSPYGIVDLTEENRIVRFVEAPVLPHWINAGVYLFEPEVTGLLPEKGDHEYSTFPRLAEEGRLHAYRIDGYWRGIDTAKDLKEATHDLATLS